MALAVALVGNGNSSTSLGLALAAASVGQLLFLLPSGVIADRWPRVPIMIAADGVRAAAVGALALFPSSELSRVAPALTLLIGIGDAAFSPASGALLPSVIPANHLQSANSLSAIGNRAATIGGPLIGGALVVAAGVRGAFAIDALSFVVSLVAVIGLAEPRRGTPGGRIRLAKALGGLDELRRRPWIGAVILTSALGMALTIAPWLVFLPVIAERDLGGTAAYTAILAWFGIGALVGAIASGHVGWRRPGVIGFSALACFALPLVALAIPARVAIVAGAAALAGGGLEMFEVLSSTGIQRNVPAAAMGKVTALEYFASGFLYPIGLAMAVPASNVFGERVVLLCAAVALPVVSGASLMIPGATDFSSAGRTRSATSANSQVTRSTRQGRGT